MVADHGVQRIAFVKISMGVGDEVREGQTVECGETGELVCFRPELIFPDSPGSHNIILTCRQRAGGAGTRIMHGNRGDMYVRTGIKLENGNTNEPCFKQLPSMASARHPYGTQISKRTRERIVR